MSARQRKKLAQELGLDTLRVQTSAAAESDEDIEEEEEEQQQVRAPVSAFQAFAESSDEEEADRGSDDEDVDEEQQESAKKQQSKSATAASSAKSKKKNKKKKAKQRQQQQQQGASNDSDVDLDELIEQHKQLYLGDEEEKDGGTGGRAGYSGRQLAQVFTIDPKSLNVELELRRQFGGMSTAAADDAYEAPEQPGRHPRRENRARAAAQAIIAKRCLFGPPHPSWPQPPSFVAGGIGMKRCDAPSYLPVEQLQAHGPAQWFQFEWSEDYHRLQAEFRDVQATNDPNALVVFLYRYPYHAEAAMQLAMVFARTGQMDRAADMVRRSLYMHECAYLEAFKPQNGLCRLDPQRPENSTYFAGLFRHMQIVGMQGCVAVSLQLARLLLSLDPLADPMATLLCLDYYCLQCQRHDILESYFQSKLPLGYSIEQCELASTFENPPKLTIADLPNWAFSMAASYSLRDDVDSAMHAMKSAVYNHPFVVPTLLAECAVNVNQTAPVDWSTVLKHEFFGGIGDRMHSSSVLLHLAEIYATRCHSIWQNEALQLMLHRACLDVLEGITPNLARHLASQQEKFTSLSAISSPLHKYRSALKEDFKDEYARLPPDMNPLDPHLVDPRALAGRGVPVRHAAHHHAMQQRNLQGLLQQMLGQDEEAMLAQLLAQQHDADQQHAVPGNLDPNMPLMQLFLQTLMPWNEIDTTAEPAPRGDWEGDDAEEEQR